MIVVQPVPESFDVVVLGEVLVELSATQPLADGATLRLGFSGDALNSAAAAAAAGARTALLSRVPADELGDRLVERIAALGISTELIIRTSGQHGVYLQHADPDGARRFVYARKGSAASTLGVKDVPQDVIAAAKVVLASGVSCAVSQTLAAAVHLCARLATRFVYDPNWRPALTSAEDAAAALRLLAPLAALVTPSWPGEVGALLGAEIASPRDACAALRAMGAAAVAVTCGPDGVVLDEAAGAVRVPAASPPAVVDQTGAGDVLAGTVAARLALGDPLVEAVALGVAAAALSLQGIGGTGHLPHLDQTRALAATLVVET